MEVYGTHTLGQLSAAAARLKQRYWSCSCWVTCARSYYRAFSFAHAQMVNKVLMTEYRRDFQWGCVMSDLALGILMLAAGLVGGGAVVVYLLRWLPGAHWGS